MLRKSLCVFILILLSLCGVFSNFEDGEHYTNDWVVGITGGIEVANQLARELDYTNLGELKAFPGIYLMRKNDHPRRSRRHASRITKRLSDDRRVEWAEQQIAKRRSKRGILWGDYNSLPSQKENDRFNDDLWSDQWYLHDTRSMESLPQLDLRTTPVWDMDITGKGVVVTVMDDGLEWNHTDIIGNYDPKASWDCNDDDDDPFPRYDEADSNNHGTRCAGEIAMTANNGKCGVGVAFNAKIGGIRMLDGSVTDVVECNALAFSVDHIDIFSASWGPNDDGKTVDGPNRLAIKSLEYGITKGRGGKGVIYVWASGNGGSLGDNCNCDGYTNSIYTLSVGSASERGEFPWYGEKCASTMTTTYSSGAYTDQKITTSDLHNKCTQHHTGTSAAAPLAAGIIALILEANPSLTWRDMQHLVVWNSDYSPLSSNRGWKRNSAGLMYNSRFGFGLMNAHSMVVAAKNWTVVPNKATCTMHSISSLPLRLSSESNDEVEVHFTSDGCKDSENEINYLEHVDVTLNINYNHRGALDIYLFSPSESISMLLSRREKDISSVGFRNWTFMTVHFWGENPKGEWKVLIRDKTGKNYRGDVSLASIKLHGTKEMPSQMKKGRKRFANDNLVLRTIDQTPEFMEQDSSAAMDSSEVLDSSLASNNKQHLDWNALVGKQLRNAKYFQPNWQTSDQILNRYFDYITGEKGIDFTNY